MSYLITNIDSWVLASFPVPISMSGICLQGGKSPPFVVDFPSLEFLKEYYKVPEHVWFPLLKN